VDEAQFVGTVVFAVSGVFAVAGRGLDWFGGIVVGLVTAVGGGTIRDLVLGRSPVFWVEDDTYLLLAVVGALVGILLVRVLGDGSSRRFDEGLQLADAAGLALFSVVGANVALELNDAGSVAIVTGVLTGVGGGVVRDLLAGRTPLVMRGEIYATAALAGVVVFVGLDELTAVAEPISAAIGMAIILGLRGLGISRAWSLPPIEKT
jgi:uncharacterized membrane protein YeiH